MGLNFAGNFARAAELATDASISEMSVDGSSSPQNYDFAPPQGQAWEIFRIRLAISDSNMSFDTFGGINGLTNGVEIGRVRANGVFTSIIEGNIKMKTNVDLATYCSDFQIIVWKGQTDTLLVDWNLRALLGSVINVDSDEKIQIRVNDDLTGLSTFTVTAFYTKRITNSEGGP